MQYIYLGQFLAAFLNSILFTKLQKFILEFYKLIGKISKYYVFFFKAKATLQTLLYILLIIKTKVTNKN